MGIHSESGLCLIHVMFQTDLFADRSPQSSSSSATPAIVPAPERLDLPEILRRLSTVSERPRHAFMVLNLIARAASATGHAGPYVRDGDRRVLVREWLCHALAPMAHRDPRRIERAAAVRREFAAAGTLPDDGHAAERLVEDEVRARVRRTGLTHVSRAVSDLVKAGLIDRYYEGDWVDHRNRGGQRHAVYTLLPETRRALRGAPA